MIVRSSGRYVPQLMEIWKSVFGDSDEYIRLFFERMYSHAESLLHVEGEKVLSMLFFPRCSIRVLGRVYRAGYVCGAATLPEARGKGLMDGLLKTSFHLMLERGDSFSVLIPGDDNLYGFYSKYDYRALFKRGVATYSANAFRAAGRGRLSLVKTDDASAISSLYSEIVSDMEVVVLKDEPAYRLVMDVYSTYGSIYLVMDGRKAEGYVFCQYHEGEKVLFAKEMMSRRDILDETAGMLADIYRPGKVVVEGPYRSGTGFPGVKRTGMLKVLDGSFEASDLDRGYPYMNMMLD